MKGITDYINESGKISREEMWEDYEKLRNDYGFSLAEKKAYAAKYGIESRKTAEIMDAILSAMRDERNTRTEYDLTDYKAFRAIGVPSRYNKLCEVLDKEKYSFVKSYFDRSYGKLDNNLKWYVDNKYSPKNNYNIQIRYRYLIEELILIKRYLDDHNPATKNSRDEEKERFNTLLDIFTKQLAPFRKEQIEKGREWAASFFETNYPRIKKLRDRNDELVKQVGLYKLMRDGGKEAAEYERNKKTIGSILTHLAGKRNKEEFVEYIAEQTGKKFDYNVRSLTDRVLQKGMKIESVKVTDISDDPKLFQLWITDGERTMYARSIWAAEGSDIVTPHFRFIITEKKGRKAPSERNK